MGLSRPKILCSACLEHCNCRYDGSVIKNETVEKLKEYVDFVTVCPEMAIGLPSPREAIRIIKSENGFKLVDSYKGTDRTPEMEKFIKEFFENNHQNEFDAVILKCKSPTCGLKDAKYYLSAGKVPSIDKTYGFFGGAIKSHFPNLPTEDDGRLMHFNIREHFLMSLFLHFEFRNVAEKVKSIRKISPLVTFHSKNKYLFMAYHQKALAQMGKIVANHDHLPHDEILNQYEQAMLPIYSTYPNSGKNTNMLLHLFGYFKNELSKDEKSFFLDQLEQYQNKKIPFSSVLMIIRSWVIRFDEPYLKEQTIFKMFPSDLIEVTDSGKGL